MSSIATNALGTIAAVESLKGNNGAATWFALMALNEAKKTQEEEKRQQQTADMKFQAREADARRHSEWLVEQQLTHQRQISAEQTAEIARQGELNRIAMEKDRHIRMAVQEGRLTYAEACAEWEYILDAATKEAARVQKIEIERDRAAAKARLEALAADEQERFAKVRRDLATREAERLAEEKRKHDKMIKNLILDCKVTFYMLASLGIIFLVGDLYIQFIK